ncbi:MAG: DnaT-like ssDNA-binding domain-containing protein [Porticoccaceae bacterium]
MTLLPERTLSVSPQLAATLGLEEALLYQLLGDYQALAGEGAWVDVDSGQLLKLLPFWQLRDLRRIVASLEDTGVLLSDGAAFGAAESFRFCLVTTGAEPPPRAARVAPARKTTRLIDSGWEPAPDVVAQLNQYGIPRDFIQAQIAEFVTYWSERNEPRHSWNAKFLKQVVRLWREEETRQVARSREVRMFAAWQPSPEAVELLNRQAGIHSNFIEDAIPEFVLYWQERGDARSTWNSDFVRHVKLQWARYTATLENDSEPRAMNREWQPSEDLFEVLQLANISREFAIRQIPEFVLFWRESGQAISSWNTKFLQHVKRQWVRHCTQGDIGHETTQGPAPATRTRDRSLVDDLTDRSWAN